MPEVSSFSKQIFQDLKDELGITLEINHRTQASEAVSSTDKAIIVKLYDSKKIARIELLYGFYVDSLLKTMQILYYKEFDEEHIYNVCKAYFDFQDSAIKAFVEGEQSRFAESRVSQGESSSLFDSEAAKSKFKSTGAEMTKFKESFATAVKKSGIQLSVCYKTAHKKCEPILKMIQETIREEYPLATFVDKQVTKAKG